MLSGGYWFWLYFAHWVSQWVCGMQRDESSGEIRAKVVRPIPLLSPGIKPALYYLINSHYASAPSLVCEPPPYFFRIIFNFPPHLGCDKSRSLCGREVRNVISTLPEFSCDCLSPRTRQPCLWHPRSLHVVRGPIMRTPVAQSCHH